LNYTLSKLIKTYVKEKGLSGKYKEAEKFFEYISITESLNPIELTQEEERKRGLENHEKLFKDTEKIRKQLEEDNDNKQSQNRSQGQGRRRR
ncbi:MAG: hypothetical protein IIT46_06890, partial [Lachnospiraceae bacterium]|nr:hypothetical protein [Lachnospiraceae bacterium]